VLSNIAYNYCSVALLQIMKEANVIMVFVGSCLAGLKTLTIRNVVNLTCICIFAALAVSGDVHYAVTGLVVQIISQVMECAKIVVMNKVLTQASNNSDSPVKSLDPLSTVTLVSPVVFVMLSAVAAFTFDRVWIDDIPAVWPLLLANCCMAFVLNCILALVIKIASGVGLTLCGVFKDVILVALSSYIFHQPLTGFQWGCFMCVVSGILVHAVFENYKEDFNKSFGTGVYCFLSDFNAKLSGLPTHAEREAAELKAAKDLEAATQFKFAKVECTRTTVADEETPLVPKIAN
jgi:drug/metabolite transporter (DMT)-like permease